MAMIVGSVTVNDNGTHAGTGGAYAVFLAMLVQIPLPDPGSPPAGFTSDMVLVVRVATMRALAQQSMAMASLIDYIKANGDVVVPIDSFGMGIPSLQVTLAGRIG
jgi:hypothetical protein